MNLKDIVLSEISKTQKVKYFMISLKITYSEIVNFIEVESRMVVVRGWDEGKMDEFICMALLIEPDGMTACWSYTCAQE